MTGIVLGLLITLQFFVSTEVLLITAIVGAVGLVLVLGYACWKHFDTVRRHAHYAAVGLACGIVTAAVLLAYPAWFALAGPAHLSNKVWSSFLDLKGGETRSLSLRARVTDGRSSGPGPWVVRLESCLRRLPRAVLSSQYLGLGVLAVVVAGLLIWRHDRRLWLFGGLSLVSLALSFGAPPRGQFAPLASRGQPARVRQYTLLAGSFSLPTYPSL